MMAVGVANPSAQGQATTSTATAATMAIIQGLLAAVIPAAVVLEAVTLPMMAQLMKVSAAMTSTTGTKMLEMVSARR